MSPASKSVSWRALLAAIAATLFFLAGCGDGDDSPDSSGDGNGAASEETLTIGAIPDQEPERLQRTYGLLSDYLAAELGVDVEYVPVTDYAGAVAGFRVGDLDAVWFGGLTGVQARLEVDGAVAVAQRDIDERFTSVFIAGADTGITPFDDVSGLSAVAGRSFTFGSESSTSGRLMPQSFLA
ncbi:MAG: PhnD/SsuA/transferrin family substrate-binding protein, partial [Acidimicrobiales bacterium]|nr:PhnD/SsuA/transferrin family substrate-binding protein [Acidimicrobiales bacterium]